MNESKFIPGIHNYCDRWCERCYFTSRCRVYVKLNESDTEANDINNKKFWDKLSSGMADTIRMIYEDAAKHGIDLDKEIKANEEEYQKNQEKTEIKLKESELDQYNNQYMLLAREWLKKHEHFDEIRDDALQKAELGLGTEEEIMNHLQTINECLEVINWYLFLISVKFKRALSGKFEDDGWEEENGFQKDSDGSAKIALIATKRTFDAWYQLFELLPKEQENLIPMLSILQKIQKKGDEEFPNAKNFVRPGFDEGL
ncbi:MAG TPA: hypothetical protein VIJ95_09330 [Hanamia sp.]